MHNLQSKTLFSRCSRVIILMIAMGFWTVDSQAQLGHVLSGVGPVDQAMAGAGTANPQDILGALHSNPASITTFETSEFSLGVQLLFPTSDLNSSVNAGAFGPMFGPPMDLSGTTASEAGPYFMPAVGYVKGMGGSRWTYGISALVVGGFGTDYPMATSLAGNPINTPQPPNGLGFGAINSSFGLMQLAPTVAYQITDNISFGLAPTLNYAMLEVSPFPAASPDDANGDGFPSYADAPNAGATGFGFQAGLLAEMESGFSVGISFKSPQKFEDFEFEGVDESGADKVMSFNLDYPMIVSAGVGYSMDKLELAADYRYIDYANTNGFDMVGFDATGAVTGFGWESISVVAVGVQYQLTDRLPVRLGYSFNENPVQDEYTFFNTPANALIQSHVSGGFSFDVTEKVRLSTGAQYGFENAIEGNWQHPQFGAVPGTNVESTLSTLWVMFGLEVAL